MKKIYLITIITLLLATTSCGDFLDRSAQNLVIPTKISQYKEMLQGTDGYFYYLISNSAFVHAMTDDVSYRVLSEKGEDARDINTYRFVYQWQDEIENTDYGFTDNVFEYLYKQALMCNTVLEQIDELEGTAEEKETLQGQALFHRAFAYFNLANLYARAYNESEPSDLCVPIKAASAPSFQVFPRATMAEVYTLIQKDLDDAIVCLKDKSIANIYEISCKPVLVLAMRTALFMGKFDEAIAYGEKLLTFNDKLYDITSMTAAVTNENASGASDIVNFISSRNPEILWSYGSTTETGIPQITGGVGNAIGKYFDISDEAIVLYSYDETTKSGDHRLPYWFRKPGYESLKSLPTSYFSYSCMKYDGYDYDLGRSAVFRTGEVYITLAEAYIRAQGASRDVSKGLKYLNDLRRNRIDHYTNLTESNFTSDESLLKFVWEERHREMFNEELHRWWDLRRTGQSPLVHKWKDGEVYRLNDHDPAYVLNFPLQERTYAPENFNIRPRRTPEK